MAEQPGVAETGAVFDAPVRDRWAIARERWDEHQRTGAATMSVDEFIAELTEEIERRQVSRI
jgi:threonyl-tRNA synthetase